MRSSVSNARWPRRLCSSSSVHSVTASALMPPLSTAAITAFTRSCLPHPPRVSTSSTPLARRTSKMRRSSDSGMT
uniref:Uncharacterized protein n=1 Tax=Phytophthora fragariae TaxID=53985 RepID=A0A6A3DA66_9STRA|nr:hypothetical protein PF009_g32492 [Phytophthora fragariae]